MIFECPSSEISNISKAYNLHEISRFTKYLFIIKMESFLNQVQRVATWFDDSPIDKSWKCKNKYI